MLVLALAAPQKFDAVWAPSMVVDRVVSPVRVSRPRLLLAVGLLTLCAPAPGGCQSGPTVAYRNTSLNVGYVGSRACGECHASIYKTYLKTDMGRSMSLAADDELARITSRVTIHDEKLNRYFEAFRQDSDMYQSEYELSSSGTEVFNNTQKIRYVIGSGENGVGFIVQQGGYLLEAPLSYYTKSKSWALSPGYELRDYGFSRTVAAGCIVCHSGLPRPAAGEYGRYNDPPFRELPIACESCHGPGELHMRERTKATPLAATPDTSIVNPAQLSGWLADNICMNCHQGGDTRVLQPGKTYSDFRPGMPLDGTVAIFALPLTPESPPASPLLEHFSLMKLSKCFRSSGGRMSCLTCHDPHVQPRANAAAYYRQRCMTCHTEQSCSLTLRARNKNSPPDDCAGCHMPRRSLTLISHAILTDHRVVKNTGEPYPEAAFRQTTPGLPDLVHVNAVPGSTEPLPPLTVFRAYSELLVAHPEFREAYNRLLDQLARTDPDNLTVLSAMGYRSMSQGTTVAKEAAARYLSLAVQLGSNSASDYQYLGSLLAEAGHTQEATTVIELGIKLDPYNERLYKALAVLNISAHRYPQALAVMKRDLDLFPEDDFMRSLVEKAEENARPSTGSSLNR